MALRLLGSRKAGVDLALYILRSEKERFDARGYGDIATVLRYAQSVFHK
ncbi:hypothetical protein [Rhodomicrobium lacus]|nr:hypothetical protein [Rhodomicrobium lacus]WKW51399.1 hypothetical protein QMO75_02605 [Rhodomicrobium lacus]